jgi:trehalose 6-phosphate phosphatase
MERLSTAPSSTLLLDYDGTLAPFRTDRHQAYPYPGVMPLLERIRNSGRSRIVIITGRPIAELKPLLDPLCDIEIWGSHGKEHLSVDGSYGEIANAPEMSTWLSQAESWLVAAGLGQRIEVKPGGIAVHWRGMPDARIESVRTQVEKGLDPFANYPGLKLLEFEGGLELRVAHPNKGDAMDSILSGISHETPIAYLGDDLTDEDAFQALNPRGLSVLVRSEYRETNAKIWLRPPEELIAFLEQWLNRDGSG